MNRSLARLRKLTHDELTEHTPEELLAMDGLIPLSEKIRSAMLNGIRPSMAKSSSGVCSVSSS